MPTRNGVALLGDVPKAISGYIHIFYMGKTLLMINIDDLDPLMGNESLDGCKIALSAAIVSSNNMGVQATIFAANLHTDHTIHAFFILRAQIATPKAILFDKAHQFDDLGFKPMMLLTKSLVSHVIQRDHRIQGDEIAVLPMAYPDFKFVSQFIAIYCHRCLLVVTNIFICSTGQNLLTNESILN
jgi:hypothetical protein